MIKDEHVADPGLSGHGRTAALHNLGCKVNSYETEAMQQQLEKAGYRIIDFEQAADVYVINTCSVTNIADRKSRQMLHRAKKRNPDAVVVAAGCYVQTALEKTGLSIDADIILGNDRKGKLCDVLEQYFREKKPVSEVISIEKSRSFEETPICCSFEHTRAFLKVQDGCNQFCSYCIIPYARGRIRSRSIPAVEEEVRKLTGTGILEIVLTGIHLSSYGKDLSDGYGLLDLIRAVSRIPGVQRIRLGSLEPGIIDPDFVGALAQIPSVCPHFHLSLQSGCDSVLKRMNRRYTAREYEEKCALLRQAFDHPALTTDVIVGFPGETEEEFGQTRAFLEKLSLYETHIFKYSRREGTAAARMKGQIPESEKTVRSDILLNLGRKNKARYEEYWTGKKVQVLFEEKVFSGTSRYWTGYTKEYVRVYMPAEDDAADYTNRICSGIITDECCGDEKVHNFRIET